MSKLFLIIAAASGWAVALDWHIAYTFPLMVAALLMSLLSQVP